MKILQLKNPEKVKNRITDKTFRSYPLKFIKRYGMLSDMQSIMQSAGGFL